MGEWNAATNPDCFKENDCADPIVEIPVIEILIHPNFNPQSPSKENDIALLRLNRKVIYTEYIHPICLTDVLTDDHFEGKTLVASGWGRTEKGTSLLEFSMQSKKLFENWFWIYFSYEKRCKTKGHFESRQ